MKTEFRKRLAALSLRWANEKGYSYTLSPDQVEEIVALADEAVVTIVDRLTDNLERSLRSEDEKAAAQRELALKQFEQERRINQGTNYLAHICLRTRVPSKWRLVDRETGEIWHWIPDKGLRNDAGEFRRIADIEIRTVGER